MNNIQVSSSKINFRSDNTIVSQPRTANYEEQSPKQLKEKIESGELNETDFPNKEEFAKFVIFLSKILGEEVKQPAKSEGGLAQKVDAVNGKKESGMSEMMLKSNINAENSKNLNSNNVNQHFKSNNSSDTEILKEGINNPAAKQILQDPTVISNTNLHQTNADLFKADIIDKSVIAKEQAVQITDKTVILHTAGGNNLSITGNDISAQGDPSFLEQTREFAPDEGFQERNNNQQHQSEDKNENESDLEKIYFTRDSDQ